MTKRENEFKKIPDSETDGETDVLAKLQEELVCLKDARNEERFIFIVIVVLLLDVVFFSVLPNLAGPIGLLALELLILVPLAKRMGMQEMSEYLDRAIHRITGHMSKKE